MTRPTNNGLPWKNEPKVVVRRRATDRPKTRDTDWLGIMLLIAGLAVLVVVIGNALGE